MSSDSRFQDFISKAKAKHGEKFDYSEVHYINQKSLVKIICPMHGEFLQTPDKHLFSKFGCSKCSNCLKNKPQKRRSKKSKYTKEYALKKLKDKFGDVFEFDFSLFDETLNGIIIVKCKTHGVFKNTALNLISQKNKKCCSKCHYDFLSKEKTGSYENFVKQSKKLYNDKYVYPKENENTYKNKKSIVKIICQIHGEFTKKAQKHISGQGCIKCMYEKLISFGVLPGGYCEKTFLENPSLKNVDAKLYYLSINNGKFFKIGITIRNTEDRIRSLKSESKGYIKNCKIIYEFKSSLYQCYKIEQKILDQYSYARSPRNWSTEIFNEDIFQNNNFLEYCKFLAPL